MRKWITAILIVVALVIVALVKLLALKPPATFTLPDGSVIEVAKITFGPTHRFRWGNRMRDVLGEKLPRKLRDRLGVRVVEVRPVNADSLVLWTRARGASGKLINPTVGWGSGRRTQVIQLGMADDHGVEVDMVPRNAFNMPASSVIARAGGGTIGSSLGMGWEFEVFPRHSKVINLNFYSLTNNQRNKLDALRLPRPAPPATDTWQPVSLPAARPLADLTVKLVWAETAASGNESELNTSLGVELTRNREPVTDWILSYFEMFTEDGPILYRARTQRTDTQSGLTVTAISSGLWPDQPWKLRFWFERTANFPADELWRLEDIPGILETNLTRQFGDWSVMLSTDKGQNARAESALANLWRTPNPGLNLTFAGPYDRTWRLNPLDARDELGRKLTLVEQQDVRGMIDPVGIDPMLDERPAGRVFRAYKCWLSPNARSSSFAFAIHQSRSVDFVVKPRLREVIEPYKLPSDQVNEAPKYVIMGSFSM